MQDERGETALFAACSQGCYDPAALLIKHGADINYLSKVRPLYVHGQDGYAQFRAKWGFSIYIYSVWVMDACRNSGLNLEQHDSVLFCAL